MSLTRLLTVTLFLSAFLLFCCQPMVGKMVLPSLGGAAAVWTTCVLFFQSMLLAGYLYAYALGKIGPLKIQRMVHAGLMVLVLLTLPIRFSGSAPPSADTSPVLWELLQLVQRVALPFFLVSTTAPLLQSWFSRTDEKDAADPYFLYAASNAGSLLALVLYPVFIEPWFGVSAQSFWWSGGYAVLAILALISMSQFRQATPRTVVTEPAPSPPARTRLFWLATSFVPSALMLAVTTHVSANLASVPFLWTLPLAVYLLTFILAYARRIGISAEQVSRVAPALLLALAPILAAGVVRNPLLYFGLLAAHLLLLFVGGLLCHSALALRRPNPEYLTEYYAWIALGGALGGVFAAILAPALFNTVLEYPLLVATLAFFRTAQNARRSLWDWCFPVFIGTVLLTAWGGSRWLGIGIDDTQIWTVAGYAAFAVTAFAFHRKRWLFAGVLASLILAYATIVGPALEQTERLHVARNFFGVKRVVLDSRTHHRKLLHGDTLHGLEGIDRFRRGQPLSYYTRTGPLGDVMTMLNDRPQQHVGVVGLGSGSIAAYAQPNRRVTFFEIDPQVQAIAEKYFTFLARCAAQCDVVLGDGRLSILNAPDREFDLIVLDAFNSDAIPAHLLSREAIQIYKRKLKPDGTLLFHVSNRYLRVRELVTNLASDALMPALYRSDEDIDELGKASSIYVIAGLETDSIAPLSEGSRWLRVTPQSNIEPWTDDYSNLWEIVRWR